MRFMGSITFPLVTIFAGVFAMSPLNLLAQAPDAGAHANSSVVDADGTAHIVRIVPVPTTLSPEAQATLRNNYPDKKQTLAERRNTTDTWQNGAGEKSKVVYPVTVKETTIAGVPVRDILPIADERKGWVLINLHGGGFNSDSGSLTESIPIANLTRSRVVAVLYRLAPEHPYPAGLDDAIAVYKELLKTYKPAHIAIYGTSAGAILTAEMSVKLRQLGLPEPAALGVFSGLGDFSQRTDTDAIFTGRGLVGDLPLPDGKLMSTEYLGTLDRKDPVISPVYADLKGMPPTLFITSTRDMLLSGTTILHRAYLRAGVDARLVVFEGLPHAFWNDVNLPESREMYMDAANFFVQQLSK
jgi:monoterpene epsilon-lactone hydrolase